MLGAFKAHWFMALVTGIGVFLTAAYFLSYFQRGFLGQPRADLSPPTSTAGTDATHFGATGLMPDLRLRERIISLALAGLVFWIGMDTGPFLRMMNGSLSALEARVNSGSVAISPGGSHEP
jgi:NADH:ubiquinone oxidoreductase subunit 4 (subunit M)